MTGGTGRGLAVSAALHILLCALLGGIALNARPADSGGPIYDVALMGAPSSAAAPSAAAEPPTAPREETRPVEPPVPARPDDIAEERRALPPAARPSAAPERPAPAAAANGGGADSGEKQSAEGDGSESGASGEDGDAGTGGVETPAVPPRVLAAHPPAYPSGARSRGDEGVVVVRFLLGRDGAPEEIAVVESSGSGLLDAAALDAARAFRFSPGFNAAGQPVRCYTYQPFAFRLR